MENACVIGGRGMVGSQIVKLFGIKKIFDLKEPTITLKEAAKCQFVFIALPTEVREDGSYITDDIVEIIKQIEGYGSGATYIIRSTVYPGFADSIMDLFGINRVVSNPEFLSESTAWNDTKNPPFILIGGLEGKYREWVKGLYQGVVKGANFILTDNVTAETAKLAMNAYFSTKVIFANQVYDACQTNGANYERVKEVLERHPFGPKNHFEIYFKEKRGVHGKCLPKDTKAFTHYTNSELTKKVMEINESL